MQRKVGEQPRVCVENVERLGMARHPASSFHRVFRQHKDTSSRKHTTKAARRYICVFWVIATKHGAEPADVSDCAGSGCVGLATVQHELDLLAQLTSLLRPGGWLSLVQAVQPDLSPDTVASSLVLAGRTDYF